MADTEAQTERKDDGDENAEIVRDALKVYDDWMDRERHNIDAGYDDLGFKAGEQWPEEIEAERVAEGRPCQTVNVLPQYVRQVTGDMRQMRPAIKVVPIDDNGDEEKAEARAGVIRYIENRSDAPSVYFQGGDSQVTCGMGAWRVVKEYASATTFNMELRVAPIQDALGVMWDLDSILPTREDAEKCLVPFDMSREKFKKLYPKATITDFAPTGEASTHHGDWVSTDTIRVGEYWCKKPVKKLLALTDDGSVEDVTDDEARAEELRASGARVEERDSFKVYRSLLTAHEVIDGPEEWPGSYIPIIPVPGEEIYIGKRVVRHGLIRFAKPPQQSLNYNVSAETESVALQPKAPFVGTEKNFEQYQDIWENVNRKNFPYLPYTPDPTNGNIPPQRVQPAVSSQGFQNGIERAERHIQAVIGIYNASIGAKSNESSGVAVNARDRQSDTGTFVYIKNWTQAICYTGKVLDDLIPHVYDTARVLRIVGEDGKTEEVKINQVGGVEPDGMTPRLINDVTTGAYDVAIQIGASYATKREESREGMANFMQGNPAVAPLIGDLYAKSQDWPLADEIGERLEILLPPEVRAAKAEKEGKPLPQSMQPPPPDPMQQQAMQWEMEAKEAEKDGKQADARKKVAEADKAEIELQTLQAQIGAQLLAPPVPPEDPRIQPMMDAIGQLDAAMREIIPVIQQMAAPPPEMPPDPMGGMMPMTEQPPSEAAFLMPEQPGPAPQF